jgi:ribosome-binding ATPase YchF (GTP1/OBG family)
MVQVLSMLLFFHTESLPHLLMFLSMKYVFQTMNLFQCFRTGASEHRKYFVRQQHIFCNDTTLIHKIFIQMSASVTLVTWV